MTQLSTVGVLEHTTGSMLTGITDLDLRVSGTGATVLYATSRSAGAVSVYSLATGAPVFLDDRSFSTDTDCIDFLTMGGTDYVVTLAPQPDTTRLYALSAGGQVSGAAQTLTPDTGPMDSLVQVDVAGQSYLFCVEAGGTGVEAFRMDGGALTSVDSGAATAPVSGLARASTPQTQFLLVTDQSGAQVLSYEVTAAGSLALRGEVGAAQGLGVAGISVMEQITLPDGHYVVVAARDSSSISVLKLGPTGSLTPVDHIADDLGTRFFNVTALETALVGDRAFVIAGGGDDGISLFELLPGGRLLHHQTMADSFATTLANVSAITATDVNGQLQIFVGSGIETGVTQLVASSGPVGTTLIGGAWGDTLTGTAAGEVMDGAQGNDSLSAGAGDDVLVDGAGQDTLRGGAGADVFFLVADSEMDVIEDFTPGVDRIDLTSWPMLRNLGQLSYQMTVDGAMLSFGTELLEIRSSSGLPLMQGEVLTWDLINMTRYPTGSVLLPDADGFTGDEGANTLTGNSADNDLRGNGGDDTLYGEGGNDTLDGGTGADRMEGGAGNDTYRVDNAGDVIVETAGNGVDHVESSVSLALRDHSQHLETLTLLGSGDIDGTGNARHNTITGNAGHNVLNGAWGNDTLIGGDGNDRFLDDGGADRMEGGAGNDTYRVDNAGDVIVETAGNGVDHVESSVSLALRDHSQHLETLTLLGGGDIDGTGNARHNTITGNAGHNVLNGAWGNDTLIGGDGNDRFLDDNGADRMEGGAGNDTYRVDNAGDVIVETAGNGVDHVESSVSLALRDHSQHLETLTLLGGGDIDGTGNGRHNTITGNAGNNVLNGAWGNDTLIGGDGNDRFLDDDGADRMEGGAGNDTYRVDNAGDVIVETAGNGVDHVESSVSLALRDHSQHLETLTLLGSGDIDGTGNARHNTITGNAGHNVLNGAWGNDTLIGGAGADTFVFSNGADVIQHFENDIDTIRVANSYFGGGLTAQQFLDTYADDSSGTTIIDLGNGNSLTVNAIANRLDLVDDIVFV